MQRTTIATGTVKEYAKAIPVTLVQTGPRTFTWRMGSFRLCQAPNFRNAGAAMWWAEQNGIKLDGKHD